MAGTHEVLVRLCLILVCSLAGFPFVASAADYYVSAGGADTKAGTSPTAAWRTLTRVNSVTLRPGDRVFLRGGDTFTGTLALDSGDRGTAASPVTLTSYGTGRATIAAGNGRGIWIYNTAGIAIANLNITGTGADVSGITFYSDLAGDVRLPFIRIDGVDVSGFGRDGIEIGSWNGRTGYNDIRVTNASLHGNARSGLFTYAQVPNVHQQVYVGHVRAFDNPGVPGSATNSGSGIVLASVDGGTIERSLAYGNGRLCASTGGPVGIWTYDSTRVVIQFNESFANRTAASWDGGGFDLDQNVSNSIVQFNYSHDNDGAGYMLAQSPLSDAHYGNVVRYNISQNDARANSYGAIEIWGRVTEAEIYNNTVFVSPAASGSPRAVRIWNDGVSDRFVSSVHLRNNILLTSGVPVVHVTSAALTGASDLRFENNDYFGGTPVAIWGALQYPSLAAWRATGQEMLGGNPVGLSADPRLVAAGSGPTLGDADALTTLAAYRLSSGSLMIDAGLNLAARFGLDPGTSDYYGTPLFAGGSSDIGAHEAALASTPIPAGTDEVVLFASSARLSGAWRLVADTTAAGGARVSHADQGAAKLANPLAAPVNYFDVTFTADGGKPYRLWMRGLAEGDMWSNDSVFVQFSDAVDSNGQPLYRIGSTSATTVNLEDDNNAGVSGWGWQDNGWGTGVFGPTIMFAASGVHTLRVQTREDGFSIDQIVLSARQYLSSSPGALKNDTVIVGSPTPPAPAPPATPAEIVIHAVALAGNTLHGNWILSADATAADGVTLSNPDRGASKITSPAAAPASYVDIPFTAEAGVPYAIWLRMRAQGDGYANDSVYVQLSDAVDGSGNPVARIGTSQGDAVVLQDFTDAPISGWGWNDNGWAALGTPYTFAQSGQHTLRIQQREDGTFIDQIVISPVKYLGKSPGAITNDATIVK